MDQFIQAIKDDDLEKIKQLHEEYSVGNMDSCTLCWHAARHGRLEILMFFHDNGYVWDEQTTQEAIGQRNLPMFKYALEKGCDWWSGSLMDAIVDHKTTEFLEYLHGELNMELEEGLSGFAAQYGVPEHVAYIHKHGGPVSEEEIKQKTLPCCELLTEEDIDKPCRFCFK